MRKTNVLERVVIDSAKVTAEQVEAAKDRLALLGEIPVDQAVSINGALFTVEVEKLTGHLRSIIEHIQKGGIVTVGDLWEAAPELLTPAAKRYASKLLPSFTPSTLLTGAQWPVPGIFPGIVTIVGDTGAGKTEYIDKKLGATAIVRFGEPIELVDADPRVVPARTAGEAISIGILLDCFGHRVAIDSLRKLVYSLDGAAMEGGIVAALFDVVTALNNVVSSSGAVLMAAFNPMMADESKIGRLHQRLAASCSGSILVANGSVEDSLLRTTRGRVSISRHREAGYIDRVDESLGEQFREGGSGDMLNMLVHKENPIPERIGVAYEPYDDGVDGPDDRAISVPFNL